MGIQIVSLFHTCTECNETEDTSVGLYLHLDEQGICSECREHEPIDAEFDDYLSLEDLLLICGHRALGLTEREALEIDDSYKYDLMHEYYYR